MEYALILPGAYLLGSISWGLIIGRVSRGIDVRKHGSGGTGATNVLRTLGPRVAALVLIADLLKGLVAALVAKLVCGTALAEALAGVLVVAGHNWPVFSRFQGGRGIATAAGALAVMSPVAIGAAAGAFAPTTAISRYISLGSIMAVLAAMVTIPILAAVDLASWQYLVYTMVAGPMILWRHRGNIHRLLSGTERRLSFGRDKASQDTSP